MEIFLVGGDARSRWVADYFRREGVLFSSCGIDTDAPLPPQFSCLVLPFPARSALAGRQEALIERCGAGTVVIGGLLGPCADAMRACGARVFDLNGSEPLTTQNAVPTAEGAIALALTHSPVTLDTSRCLVIGYGRIGKALARRLQALHADVTVSARKEADMALAQAMGLRAIRTGHWDASLARCDFIFNTVPAEVLTREDLSVLHPDCLLLELASRSGFSPKACGELGLMSIAASGLPGKFSPKTAGYLYARAVLSLMKKEGAL